MKDLENLKKQVDAKRRSGRGAFKESLKAQIIKAAEKLGKTKVITFLNLSPSSFYKWLKSPKRKPASEDINSTPFIEIPHTSMLRPSYPDCTRGSEFQVKWEAVRPDGSILRCELNNQKVEVGSIFNSFLKDRVVP